MKWTWLDKKMKYDGTQLRSHFVFEKTGTLGDAIVSFAGPADVSIKNMVDLVDVRNNDPIFSKEMLHFIVESFGEKLELGIAKQRLLVAIAVDTLKSMNAGSHIKRSGNDIYDGDKKVSVSIAAISPVSTCIHFAINIISEGTPVPTKGLNDYGIDPKKFALKVMKEFCDEMMSMKEARCKVKPIA